MTANTQKPTKITVSPLPIFLLSDSMISCPMKTILQLFGTFITLAILLGCTAANVQQTYTANGAAGYQISCGGVFGGGDVSMCYLAAGKTCEGKGYSVTHTGVNSIIIACKSSEDPAAIVELAPK